MPSAVLVRKVSPSAMLPLARGGNKWQMTLSFIDSAAPPIECRLGTQFECSRTDQECATLSYLINVHLHTYEFSDKTSPCTALNTRTLINLWHILDLIFFNIIYI